MAACAAYAAPTPFVRPRCPAFCQPLTPLHPTPHPGLQRLEGTLDPATGRVDLDFLASFEFTAGPLYTAAPLTVATTLTTETSEGVLQRGTGERLAADGHAKLVGVARVPTTGDSFLDTFLMLPTDCLAVLSAELKFA